MKDQRTPEQQVLDALLKTYDAAIDKVVSTTEPDGAAGFLKIALEIREGGLRDINQHVTNRVRGGLLRAFNSVAERIEETISAGQTDVADKYTEIYLKLAQEIRPRHQLPSDRL